jgi:hypothetical protein
MIHSIMNHSIITLSMMTLIILIISIMDLMRTFHLVAWLSVEIYG